MSMTEQDMEFYQGEAVPITIPVTDSAGDPVELTGKTATWKVTAGRQDSTAVLEKTTADATNPIIFIDSAGTKDAAKITLAKADTESLPARTYFHELRLTSDNRVVMEGKLTLIRSVTK